MKNFILLSILVFSNLATSQTAIKFLENSNLAIKDTIVYSKVEKISLKNGIGDYKDVGLFLSCNKKSIEKLTVEKLNMLILQTNSKAKYSLKNPSSYSPIKISIFYSNETKEWSTIINYTGKNNFGATLDSKLYVSFDENGEFLKQF
jgi:hypothetical protein